MTAEPPLDPAGDAGVADLTDLVDLVAQLHRLLRSRRATLATAESLTGGLIAAAITEVAGSSATFRGGVVSYATDLKASLLGVDPTVLGRHGPVHAEVAAAMARGVRDRLRATYGLASTGVAGPDGQHGRPPGEVHLALAGPDVGHFGVVVKSLELAGDRAAVRSAAVRHAVAMTVDSLRNSDV
jgi:nicotinamide-nucleotide amidase